MGVSGLGIRVEGLTKRIKGLERLGVSVVDLKAAMSAVAKEGARLAASFAPSRSGDLRAAIRGNNAKNRAVVTAGKRKVLYAGAINYGWPKRKIRGSFFMQRADKELQPRAQAILEEGLQEAIRNAGVSE
jgi:hypothetical protein